MQVNLRPLCKVCPILRVENIVLGLEVFNSYNFYAYFPEEVMCKSLF